MLCNATDKKISRAKQNYNLKWKEKITNERVDAHFGWLIDRQETSAHFS